MVRPSCCIVKGGIPSSRRYLPKYLSCATLLLFTSVHVWCAVLRVRCSWPLGSRLPVCTLGVLCVPCPASCGSRSPVCPLAVLCCVCGLLSHLAPVHRCVCSACCVVCAVSCATWLPSTGVHARGVVLRVQCPGPLGSCSPVCMLGVLCCVLGVLGHLAPVQRCARSVCSFSVRGALGHLAPVHQCARSVCCVLCAVSWATWLLFIGVHAWCVVLCLWCPGRLGCCSPMCTLGVFSCVCGVLGALAPVHQCARLVSWFACAVFWARWLSPTGVHAPWLCVPCPG